MHQLLELYNFYYLLFFFFKQKTAYEMRISDWSSDVCSSDLTSRFAGFGAQEWRKMVTDMSKSPFTSSRYSSPSRKAAFSRTSQESVAGSASPPSVPRCTMTRRRRSFDWMPMTADRKSTRLNSRHTCAYRMPNSAGKKT